MSAKKGFLMMLMIIALALIIGGGYAQARISINMALPENAQPYLGKELIISTLDNEQYLPAVAYNPLHKEYLVVWHNNWGGGRDIYAQRINSRGELLSWFSIFRGPCRDRLSYPLKTIPSIFNVSLSMQQKKLSRQLRKLPINLIRRISGYFSRLK